MQVQIGESASLSSPESPQGEALQSPLSKGDSPTPSEPVLSPSAEFILSGAEGMERRAEDEGKRDIGNAHLDSKTGQAMALEKRGDGVVPHHVAIIMDGNGRWAKQRGLPRLAGHRVGVDCIQNVLEVLAEKGVKCVTLYAFSTENWNRPAAEVQGIMEILREALRQQTQVLHQKNVHVVHIGKVDRLSPELREAIAYAQWLTRDNTGITLNVAFDYGGRDEILEAVRRIIRDGVPAEGLDEALFSSYLFTAHVPDPDLIIRTGGELRISNFLLWQSAYSEYYLTPTLWPDLDAAELEQALASFGRRQRRFGKVNPEG